jgi:NADH:ubiquinone oxidoreductase subunit D
LKIKSYLGTNGDSYDRYLIRMLEMIESLNIISYISSNLYTYAVSSFKYSNLLVNKYFTTSFSLNNNSMEDLISHFLF